MANIAATHSSNSDEWSTPAWLFDLLYEEFRFTIDVAASPENTKLPMFYTEAEDGLAQEWWGVAFCNPPYSKSAKWIQKGYLAAMAGQATVVLLVGARPDTSYWWRWVRHGEVRFLPGRLRFIGAEGGSAPFPSAVVIFRENMNRTPTTVYWDVHDPDKKRRGSREKQA